LDKSIQGGCSQRRPDCLIDTYTHSIIIECDENQHELYDTTCEQARINELFTDLADRPIVFIRFNPDAYVVNRKKHKSSFKYDKTQGVPIIRDKNKWKMRLSKLKKVINYNISNVPCEPIQTIQLFFNQS
jgi:hypothetical protein